MSPISGNEEKNLKSLWLNDNRDLPANRAKYFACNHAGQEILANQISDRKAG